MLFTVYSTRKGFKMVDCHLCGVSGNWNHLNGKKHRNNVKKKTDRELFKKLYAEELFKKLYAETYLSIKYIPWREKMRKELEIFEKRGVWNGFKYNSGTPESVIRATFSSLRSIELGINVYILLHLNKIKISNHDHKHIHLY